MKRNCPKCGKEIEYKNKTTLNNAVKKNTVCKKCLPVNKKFVERYATKGKNTGSDNPFFGKTHTEETKKSIIKNRNYDSYKTPEFREKMRMLAVSGITGNGGKKVYDIWVEKYGVEEADKKMAACKKKHSKNNSGSGNPMYGKPSPNGSGNGWKGWYKERYFRSLRELTYMLQLEESGINWVSAENIRIPYKCPLGKDRTYSPDFLIENKLVEIKPIRLQETPLVSVKTLAAEEYCKKNNLIYEIIDVNIDTNLIDKYINDIKFAGNYKERYEKWKKVIS